MKKQVSYRMCEQGHIEPPQGYWYLGCYNNKLWSGKNYCVSDGSKVFWVQTDEDSEEFKELFSKISTNVKVHCDNYDMICENGHIKNVGGYGNNRKYKFCEICGTTMITINVDEGLNVIKTNS